MSKYGGSLLLLITDKFSFLTNSSKLNVFLVGTLSISTLSTGFPPNSFLISSLTLEYFEILTLFGMLEYSEILTLSGMEKLFY